MYKVTGREEGHGKPFIRSFKTLSQVQTYVKDRWEGADYIDGPNTFHSDYATFRLTGCTLADLGHRAGDWGTDQYWNWIWNDLSTK